MVNWPSTHRKMRLSLAARKSFGPAAGCSHPAVEPLPSIAGVQGMGLAADRSTPPPGAVRRASSLTSVPRSSLTAMTPSMARIADRDLVVEVQGFPLPPPFKVGGKQGNAVTRSTLNSIHRGWRIVAVAGQRVAAQDVCAALAAVQKCPRYTVTFRVGERDAADDEEDPEADLREAEEAERRRREMDLRQLENDQAERARREAEEVALKMKEAEDDRSKRKQADEAERKRRLEELERAESLRREVEELERKRREAEEAEHKRRAAEEADRTRQEAAEAQRKTREAGAAEVAEAQRQRLEGDRRLQAEAEAARLKLELEEMECRRREAQEAECLRREAEVAAEERERNRREAEVKEERRLEADEAERKRSEAEEIERQRRAAEEAERLRCEAAEETRRKRREAEEAQRQQMAGEEAAAEAEQRRREAEEAEERKRREAQKAERRQEEAEEAEQKRQEAEEKRKKQAAEAERKQREATEAERKRREAEEAERDRRKRDEEEAERRRMGELVGERRQAEKSLQQSTGLPPREQVKEPQKALMAALMSAKPKSQAPKKKGPCDKCDGPHHADDCPHFKKQRDKHKDAWDKKGKTGDAAADGLGNDVPHILRSAKVVRQPGDGSCLFHSLAYGLSLVGGKSADAERLRAEIADFIASHPEVEVADNPIKDWVLWDSGLDTASYARSMRAGSRWGGAVELAVCAKMRRVCVDVYEQGRGGFVRISSFGESSEASREAKAVNLLYGGRVHYDALQT
ncbi:unnamed protein product [Polarella glacialis]|uniref:Ubiquitin thioesterase OTU n=1 Tax=Polarella glacialis TaxID=89957 RepID=A0A813GRV3_POLGL|nr:unnamed protein product [Polarella glacialis]